MRILLTVHQFLPTYAAGTEIVTYKVARGLIERGHTVEVIAGHPGTMEQKEESRLTNDVFEDIPVQRFHHASVPMAGQTNIMRAEYTSNFVRHFFGAALKRFKPDVVHMFHLSRLTTSVIDACVERNIPTCYTITDFWPICPTAQLRLPDNTTCPGPSKHSGNCLRHVLQSSGAPQAKLPIFKLPTAFIDGLVWLIQKRVLMRKSMQGELVRALAARIGFNVHRLNQIDRILVLTRTMESVLLRYGVNPSRISVLPHGIDASYLQRTEGRGEKAELRIGFIGQIYEHKGVHVLVEAIRKLPRSVNVHAHIYGNLNDFPEYVQRLRDIAGDDPRIHLEGTFPNAQVGGIIGKFDVIVVPSLWYENTPLVIYEAMASGCPVVCSRFGGMAEMVRDNVDGMMFEKGNVAELAGILEKLAADRALLKKLAANTQRPKQISTYVDEVEAIYSTLIQAHGAAVGV
ncbi:MAG TPA: glycosyltransferase family 4 protein [Phycisphaerae bacterium]|nr:glycosyltransferase family 4 protein [Phycisphaerae bacterium]